MNPLTLLANAYLRWRHSHGFGVHSPFAYNLVTMAVRPGKYGYYGYELIDRVILTPGKRYDRDVRRDARLLLRLLVALGSRRLLIAAADPEPFRAAAEGAGIGCVEMDRISAGTNPSECAPQEGDCAVIRGESVSPDEIATLLKNGCAIMMTNPSPAMTDALNSSISNGTIFTGTRIVLWIPRRDMALVSYSMKF